MVKKAQFLPALESDDISEVFSTEDNFKEPEQLTDEELKYNSLLDSLNSESNAFISVSRQMSGGNSPMEFVARFPVDKFDHAQLLEHLRANYGGGDYRVVVYSEGKIRANKLFTIAAPRKQETGVDSTLKMIMDQMEKQNQQLLAIMKEKQAGGQSEMEFLQKMMIYKKMFTDERPARQVGGIGDILDTVEGLKALGIPVGNQPIEQEPGLNRLFDLAVPLVQKAMESPTPVPVARQPVLSNPQPRENNMNQMIAIGLIPLVKAAAKNSDPAVYAPMVLDNVDEANIRRFFNSPTGMADLIKIQPAITNHLAWFELLGEHVKAHLGLPSKVDHLYEDEESASVNGIETATGAPADERDSQLHDDANP